MPQRQHTHAPDRVCGPVYGKLPDLASLWGHALGAAPEELTQSDGEAHLPALMAFLSALMAFLSFLMAFLSWAFL